jgi:hypothetical protein
MNNQQHGAQSTSYGMPPLFAFNHAVLAEDCQRIVENTGGRFEREPVVLPPVDPVLFLVPPKPASLYKMYNTVVIPRPRGSGRRERPPPSLDSLADVGIDKILSNCG